MQKPCNQGSMAHVGDLIKKSDKRKDNKILDIDKYLANRLFDYGQIEQTNYQIEKCKKKKKINK